MAESTALMSVGVTVTFDSLAGELTDINKDPDTTDQADVTHQASPDKFREFKSGFTNGGTVTINMNLNGAPAMPEHGKNGSLVITIPAATGSVTMTVPANCERQGSIDGPLGEKVSTEVGFQITGKPVWAAA